MKELKQAIKKEVVPLLIGVRNDLKKLNETVAKINGTKWKTQIKKNK